MEICGIFSCLCWYSGDAPCTKHNKVTVLSTLIQETVYYCQFLNNRELVLLYHAVCYLSSIVMVTAHADNKVICTSVYLFIT